MGKIRLSKNNRQKNKQTNKNITTNNKGQLSGIIPKYGWSKIPKGCKNLGHRLPLRVAPGCEYNLLLVGMVLGCPLCTALGWLRVEQPTLQASDQLCNCCSVLPKKNAHKKIKGRFLSIPKWYPFNHPNYLL